MTKVFLFIVLLSATVTLSLSVQGQKIEYSFGNESDVTDSIKYVVDWYKSQYKTNDVKKLNLYVTIVSCNGYLDIHISQHTDNDENMRKLVKASNRMIRINKNFNLPVIFETDILSPGLSDRAYINMNGYYIKAEKNDRHIWKVTQMNVTF